jgi:MFS transporter, PCFT/HCP family, solute carrier family 46, member 3
MYSVHKKEHQRKAIEMAASQTSEFSTATTATNVNNNVKGESTANGGVVIEGMKDGPVDFSSRLNHRLGSIRNTGVVNTAFTNDDGKEMHVDGESKIVHETLEIVKDMPALHLEHCKL